MGERSSNVLDCIFLFQDVLVVVMSLFLSCLFLSVFYERSFFAILLCNLGLLHAKQRIALILDLLQNVVSDSLQFKRTRVNNSVEQSTKQVRTALAESSGAVRCRRAADTMIRSVSWTHSHRHCRLPPLGGCPCTGSTTALATKAIA